MFPESANSRRRNLDSSKSIVSPAVDSSVATIIEIFGSKTRVLCLWHNHQAGRSRGRSPRLKYRLAALSIRLCTSLPDVFASFSINTSTLHAAVSEVSRASRETSICSFHIATGKGQSGSKIVESFWLWKSKIQNDGASRFGRRRLLHLLWVSDYMTSFLSTLLVFVYLAFCVPQS